MRAFEIITESYSVDELVKKLTKAADAYYNTGETIMSDADYDALEAMLRDLDPDNPFFLKVGSETRGDKVKLPVTMGSLDQVHEGELTKWIANQKLDNIDIVVADKLDGNSILLVYNDMGNLQVAFTRGTGVEGQDVTRHIRQMKNVPLTNIKNLRFVVAEIIIPDDVFQEIKEKLQKETGKVYKNPRNFVAGQMNKKVASSIFYEYANVVAYGLRKTSFNKSKQYQILQQNGFITAKYKIIKGKDLSDEELVKLLDDRHKESPYALDGLVLDVDDYKIAKKMASEKKSSSLNPPSAKKFKVGQAENVTTSTVLKVHWKVSKDGYLKPRVEIEPVDLMGVTVRFATGFNAKFIVDNKIGPGAKITITRSGDVIPFIKGIVIQAAEPSLPDPTEFGTYRWSEPNAQGKRIDLILTNIEGNESVKLRRLIQFFSALSIEFISHRSLEKLFSAGFTTPESIITAKVQDIQAIVGEVNGRKGMISLSNKLTNIKPWILAGAHPAFGRGIGQQKLKKVFDQYHQILDLTLDQLVAVEGIEINTAKKIKASEDEYKKFLKAIDGFYSLDNKVDNKVITGELVGEYIVFTGFRDAELQAKLEAAGAEVGNSKSKMTILVAKDPNSNSSKLRQAIDKGIKVIGIEDAWELI